MDGSSCTLGPQCIWLDLQVVVHNLSRVEVVEPAPEKPAKPESEKDDDGEEEEEEEEEQEKKRQKSALFKVFPLLGLFF